VGVIWHHLSWPELWRQVKSSSHGLTPEVAAERLKLFGLNELPSAVKVSWWKLFWGQFANTLIVVLLVAAGLSLALGEVVDALVILAAVVINVLVGFIQEARAEAALDELRKFVRYQTRVVRQGHESIIGVEQLVPGDVIHLAAGDRVPADSRLIEVHDLETNEALLTGESQPVNKSLGEVLPGTVLAERTNMVYSGTSITRGDGLAVVIGTGSQTELGSIARLLNSLDEAPTPLQDRLAAFGRNIGLIALSCCAFILASGLALGYEFRQMFTMAVAIAVSSVPEGLVVVVTAVLAIGMHRILHRQVLVRRLMAAETLGSTTVICVDKTGTLTAGDMRVALVLTPDEELNQVSQKIEDGSSSLTLLKVGVLASDAYVENPNDELEDWVVVGSPTEKALVLAGQQVGLDVERFRLQHPKLDVIPFSSERKYMVTLHALPHGSRAAYLKGAPEKVIAACSQVQALGASHKLTEEDRKHFLREAERLSRQGLRLLAFASRDLPSGTQTISQSMTEGNLEKFTFLGFVGLKDPLRPEVAETMRLAWRAGIRVVMITGDHRLTAKTIAEEIGLPADLDNILDGEKLGSLSDQELAARVAQTSVFARTAPHDKLRIVHAWQAKGEVVAMTGDGVNDSPALKAADIGVALGSGSDVAKEASDMVLLNNNVASIVAAVEEGRTIYDNIRKVVFYLMSDSFAEMVLILGAFIISLIVGHSSDLPILATQILWVNLVADTFVALALAVDPAHPAVMEQAPIKRGEPIFDNSRKFLIGFISLLKGLGLLAIFMFLTAIGTEVDDARTIVFTLLALTSLASVFSLKHLDRPLWHSLTWNNPKLIGAVIIGLGLQLLVVYWPFMQGIFHTVPLSSSGWLLIVSFCALLVFSLEVIKYFVANRRSYLA
jgi:Ca2+-transporting ATPase